MASPRLSVVWCSLLRKSQLRNHLRHSLKARTSFLEKLEDRRLLAVTSPPTQMLPVIDAPLAIESGLIDNDPVADLAAVNRAGQLSVALNANDGSWRSVNDLQLGLGTTFGMTGSLLNGDPYLDLVTIEAAAARVLLGDGVGSFRLGPTLSAPSGGRFQPTDNASTVAAIGLLNDDLSPDIVMLDTALNRVAVYYGLGNADFTSAQVFATAGVDPTAIAIGDVVGDDRPEIIVGHRDGKLSFLVSTTRPDGFNSWSVDAAATVHNSSPIRALAVADIDRDGDQDM